MAILEVIIPKIVPFCNETIFVIEDVRLNDNTPVQLITELITAGVLSPETELPVTDSGFSARYGILNKSNEKVNGNLTFKDLGFTNGDTLRIIVFATT